MSGVPKTWNGKLFCQSLCRKKAQSPPTLRVIISTQVDVKFTKNIYVTTNIIWCSIKQCLINYNKGNIVGVIELFSKRLKKNEKLPDVYIYSDIPNHLRVQIIHIIRDTIGEDKSGYEKYSFKSYEYIHKNLCKEYGVFSLKNNADSDSEAIFDFFLKCDDYTKCLDIIELTFKIIENFTLKNYSFIKENTTSSQEPEDAINELNLRFKESAIGYQYESGEIIKVDSQFVHSEAVKPVLYLLASEKRFKGTNDEFLTAHEHYRNNRYKECINDCLKSFESLMKVIHEKHSWNYKSTDTAKKLINSCLNNNLIPSYLETQFSSIRSLLESGIPTIRNKEGGHGQGSELSEVPEHLASYILHLTATNLLFLANCEKKYKKK